MLRFSNTPVVPSPRRLLKHLLTSAGVDRYRGSPAATLDQWSHWGYGPDVCSAAKHLRYDPVAVRAWLVVEALTARFRSVSADAMGVTVVLARGCRWRVVGPRWARLDGCRRLCITVAEPRRFPISATTERSVPTARKGDAS